MRGSWHVLASLALDGLSTCCVCPNLPISERVHLHYIYEGWPWAMPLFALYLYLSLYIMYMCVYISGKLSLDASQHARRLTCAL